MADLKPNPGVTRDMVACEGVSFLWKVLFACGKSGSKVCRARCYKSLPFVVEMASPFLCIG